VFFANLAASAGRGKANNEDSSEQYNGSHNLIILPGKKTISVPPGLIRNNK
jgi:hypothetical protein